MFNLFKSKPTVQEQLAATTTKDVVIRQANKQAFYYEIINDTVRIYNRGAGFVMEVSSPTPMETALKLITEYNSKA